MKEIEGNDQTAHCLELLNPLKNVFKYCSPITLLRVRSVCTIWNTIALSNSLWQSAGAMDHQDFVMRTNKIESKNVRKMVLEGLLKLPHAEKISHLIKNRQWNEEYKLLCELCPSSINLDLETYNSICAISGADRRWYIELILGLTSPQDLLSVFASENSKTGYHYRNHFYDYWGIVAQQLNLVSITALHNIPKHANTYSIEAILCETGVKFMQEGHATFRDLIQMQSSHCIRSLLVPNAITLFKQGLACFNDFKDSNLHPNVITDILSDTALIVMQNKWFNLKELLSVHSTTLKVLLSDNAVNTFKKHGLINKEFLLSEKSDLKQIFSDKVFLACEQDIMRYTWLIPLHQVYRRCEWIFSDNALKSLKNGWLTHALMEDIAGGEYTRISRDCSTLSLMLSDDQAVQAVEKGWVTFDEAIQLHRDGRYDILRSLLTDGTRPSGCTIF